MMAASYRRSRGERYASNLSSTSGIVEYSYVHDASGTDSRNGGVYAVRKHPVMQAVQISDLLKRRIAFLSGGKDKRGGPIISFPTQSSEVSLEDIATCVSYLATIPSEEAKDHGYSIIADMRTSTWQSLKAFFKVLQESIPSGIHSVYVIKPDAFWESKRASLSLKKDKPQYGFETLMLSNVSKLTKFIDARELTEDFGGTLLYNHNEWVQNRIDFEKFLKDSEVVQHRFDQADEEVLYRRRDEQLTPEDLLRRQRRLREVVINQPSSVLQLGHALLRRIKEDSESGFRRNSNEGLTEDQVRLKGQLEQVLEELQERQSKLKIYLSEKDRELGVNMDLSDLETGIKKVVDWMVGPGEKLLASQVDIGDSLAAADQLRREHEKLELKCTDTYGNFAELRHVADSMIKQGHPRADDISAQKEFMETVCRSYASRLEKRRNLLICSVRFHRLAEECFGKMDVLLELCVTEISIETVEMVEIALRELTEQCEAVAFAAEGSKEEGHSLLSMMSLPVKNAFGKDITPNYTKQKDHVDELLAELEGRKARCDEMSDMRKLKLQQILQLRTCERDADQAIAWLQELLQVMLSQHIDIGRSAAEAENLRKEHNKFEDTARGTYNYGKELLSAALVLRRSLRFDPEPNHEKAQILERAWRRFSQGLGERASRLSVSHMFQRNAERLVDQMDRICLELAPQITSSDPHTSRRLLNAYSPRRDSLLREYGDTMAMGKALLDRMVLPVLSPDRTVRSPSSSFPDELQPQVNNIRQKLSELEAKKREMDKIWGLPVSSPEWQRSGSYRSIPDWQEVTQREDVMEPVTRTRQEGSQMSPSRRVPSSERLDPRRVASPTGRMPQSNGRMGPGPDRMDTSPSRPYGQHPGASDRSPQRMTSPHDSLSSPHNRVSSPHDRMSSPYNRMTSPHDRSASPSARIAPPVRATAHPGAVDEPIRPVAVSQVQTASPAFQPPPPNGRMSPSPTERVSSQSSAPQLQRKDTAEDEAMKKLEEFEALVHESTEWIRVKVEEMTPKMTDVGTTLEEALQLRQQHNDMLKQLASKQQHINSLLTQADFLVSTQQFYDDVYEAMAQSLGEAWKDLNLQLEERRKLLDQSVAFHQSAAEFSDKLEKANAKFRSPDLPPDIPGTDKLMEDHHKIREDILTSSMDTMNLGKDLVEQLHALSKDASPDDKEASKQSSLGVQNVLDDLQDRRRALEDLWNKQRRRLEQYIALSDLDQEVNQISDWIKTRGEDYLKKKDVGDETPATERLFKEHLEFQTSAEDMQGNVHQLRHTAEQICHSNPEHTDHLRSQTRAIETLSDDYMRRLAFRGRLLQAVLDFYKNAELAQTYLSQVEIQLSPKKLPSEPHGRAARLAQLGNAVAEISEPVIKEGHTLLERVGRGTPGAQGIKDKLDLLETQSERLQSECSPEAQHRSSLQVSFDESYSVIVKWLVNVADTFLSASNDMGDQLQTSMDFQDGHQRLMDDILERAKQVDKVFKISSELIPSLADREQVTAVQNRCDKLQQHWSRVTVCVDKRLHAVLILIKFHKHTKQLTNAMENMEEQLNCYISMDAPDIPAKTVQHLQEKWSNVIEIYVQFENTGRNFLSEASAIKNDPELDITSSKLYVSRALKGLEERKQHLSGLYDMLTKRLNSGQLFLSKWQKFVQDARQTMDKAHRTETEYYPQVASDMSRNPNDAKGLPGRLAEFEDIAKRVSNELKDCIDTADSLGKKGDTKGGREHLIDDLSKLYHHFLDRTGKYRTLLSMMVGFYDNVNKLNKAMDETEKELQIPYSPSAPTKLSEAKIQLKRMEEQKKNLEDKFDETVNEGEKLIAGIQKIDPVSVSKADIELALHKTGMRKDRLLTNLEQQKRKVSNSMGVAELQMHKSELTVNLAKAQKELKDMQGNYGDTVDMAQTKLRRFDDWRSKIEPLEDQIKSYLSSATAVLKQNPPESAVVRHDMDQVMRQWNTLNLDIDDHRDKLVLSIDFQKLFKTTVEWQNKGNGLLLAIGRRIPLCRSEEEAHQLMDQVDEFLEKGEKPQKARLQKLNELAKELYGPDSPTFVSQLNNLHLANNRLLSSFENKNDELFHLAERLQEEDKKKKEELEEKRKKLAEERKAKQPPHYAPVAKTSLEKVELSKPPVVETPLSQTEYKPEYELNLAALDKPMEEEVIVKETVGPVESPPKPLVLSEQLIATGDLLTFDPLPSDTRDDDLLTRQTEEPVEFSPPVIFEETLAKSEVKPAYKLDVSELDGPVEEHPSPVAEDPLTQDEHQPSSELAYDWSKPDDDYDHIFKPTHVKQFGKLVEPEPDEKKRKETLPYFARFTQDCTVKEGRFASFDCVVKGEPEPDVFWEKDGVQLEETAQIKMEFGDDDSCILNFTPARLNLSGTYVCKAVNTVGEATCSAKLTVISDSKIVPEKETLVSSGRVDLASKKAPRFTWNPGNRIVDEGKPFTLAVEVEGEPSPTVIWTKDGERLGDDFYRFKHDGDTHSLIIDDVLPEDEGTYIATATNPVGKAECTIQITVNEAGSSPHFTKPLQDVEAIEGQRLQLQCLLTGNPLPTVNWYKDGECIDDHPDYEISRDKQGVCMLDIDEIFKDDSGRFTCIAKNEFGKAETTSNITVTSVDADRPPEFISQLHLAMPLVEGKPCQLEAQVEAKPPPSVSWYKDGKVIRNKPRYKASLERDTARLDIPDVLPEDAGVYECVASNPAGTTKSTVDLKIPAYDKAPEFATKPELAEPMKEGRPCHIECQISAKPAPIVTWYKDGKPIKDGWKYRTSYLKGIACLDINDALSEDAGVYECVATNRLGTAKSTVEVMVPGYEKAKPPEFVSKMQVAEPLLEGRPFHIECPVSAQPPPTISWYKDGKPLQNQPRYRTLFLKGVASVDIDEATPEDSGVYECVATNPLGTATSTVKVMIPAYGKPPEFVSKMQVAEPLLEGRPFHIECPVSAQPPPTITWYKDGKPLMNQPRYRTSFVKDVACLDIENAGPEDAGVYECVATNPLGTAISTMEVMVPAYDKPPEFVSKMQVAEPLLEGRPFHIECPVSAQPPPTITWYKDSKPLMNQPRYRTSFVKDVACLDIENAGPEDAGVYECVAANPLGTATSTVEVMVPGYEKPPEFVAEMMHGEPLIVGRPYSIECQVSAKPTPTITWYKDGKPIENEPRFRTSFDKDIAVLDIEDARPEDAGIYECVATNAMGTSKTTVEVNVPGSASPKPPEFTSKLQVAAPVTVGQPLHLECQVQARPEPTVTWYKDGKPVKGKPYYTTSFVRDVASLDIESVVPEDSGIYKCVAKNLMATVSTTVEVIVKGLPKKVGIPPKFTSRLPSHTVVATEGQPTELQCTIVSERPPTVAWYKDERTLTNYPPYEISFEKGVAALRIAKTEMEHAGTYKCVASNKAGIVTSTAEVMVRAPEVLSTDEEMDTSQGPTFINMSTQESVTVTPGQELRLTIRIQGLPPPHVTWYRNDTQVIETETVEVKRHKEICSLVIKNAQPEDSGTYKVVAENAAGVESNAVHINVAEQPLSNVSVIHLESRPQVSGQPIFVETLEKKTEVVESARVRLEVVIVGNPPPKVTWYFKDRPIRESDDEYEFHQLGNKYTLIVKKPSASDAGTYYCEAENTHGAVRSECHLTIKEKIPPDFEQPLESIAATEGEVITFEGKIKGTPKPEIKWFKDDKPVFETSRVRFVKEGDKIGLLIINVRPGDAGNYKVTLTNMFGQSTSSAILSVDVPKTPPDFAEPLVDQTAVQGERVEFHCQITGDPQPLVVWFKNGAEIEPSRFVQITSQGLSQVLIIPEVVLEDAGTYSVKGSNDAGDCTSVAQLHVGIEGLSSKAPRFVRAFGDRSTYEGDVVRFDCYVRGDPKPEVNWYKDGVLVNEGVFQVLEEGDKHSLIIGEVFDEDAGTYKCQAKNKYGETTCSAVLTIGGPVVTIPTESDSVETTTTTSTKVTAMFGQRSKFKEDPPKFSQPVKSVSLVQGKPASFEAVIQGNPEPSVRWFKDDTELRNSPKYQIGLKAGHASLRIPKVTAADAGKIKCEARNSVGTAVSTAELVVKDVTDAPRFTQRLQSQQVREGDRVCFEVTVSGLPAPTVSWFHNKDQLKSSADIQIGRDGDRCTLTIPEVFDEDAGEYTVRAENAAGVASSQAQLNVSSAKGQKGPIPAAKVTKEQDAVSHTAPPPPPPPQSVQLSAPVFTKPLSDVHTKEGQSTTLSCTLKGQPQPTIAWYREGSKIEPSLDFEMGYSNGVATLTIPEVFMDDAGKFTCTATNPAGSRSTSCQLRVTGSGKPQTNALNSVPSADSKTPSAGDVKPEFVKEMQPMRFNEGMTCRFDCTVKGKPFPEITWLRNGAPIAGYRFIPRQDIKTGFVSLEITMMLDDDIGEYTCIAKNGAGEAVCKALLMTEANYNRWARQKYEEQVRSRPQDQEYYADYQEGPLSPSRATLHGGSVDQEGNVYHDVDQEPFSVPAFEAKLLQDPNLPGMVTETETETELSGMETDAERSGAPCFVKELRNFKVLEGSPFTFSCRVEGSPKPTIQWFKNGQPVVRSNRVDVKSTEGFCSLRIEMVLPEDKGAYTVFAANPKGRAVNTGRLYVDRVDENDMPQHMKGVLAHRVREETQEYHIPERGAPDSEVNERHYKPSIKEIPSDLIVKEGQIARFNCRVKGRPPPDLVWYRDGQRVYSDPNHRMLVNEGGVHSLLITHAKPEDSGQYRCVASNRAGESEFTVGLSVEAKQHLVAPSFIDRIENETVMEGEPITLNCKVSGAPMPQVNWQKDGHHITRGSNRYRIEMLQGVCSFSIDKTSREDSGWYTCTAFNSAGRVSCRCKVQVTYQPPIGRVPGTAPPLVKKKAPTQQSRPPAEPRSSGSIFTRPDQFSDDEAFPKTPEPRFTIPLNDVHKKEGENARFACRLEPANDETMRVEWLKNGMPLFAGSRIKTSCEFGLCHLEIQGIYPEDAGIITCRAANASGHTETSGRLSCQTKGSVISDSQLPADMQGIQKTLKYEEYLRGSDDGLAREKPLAQSYDEERAPPPNFVISPRDVKKHEGKDARFACKIEPTGDGTMQVEWLRNGRPLFTSSRIKTTFEFGIASLDIKGVYAEDAGVITCCASNESGKNEVSCKLIVHSKDSLIMESQLPDSMRQGIEKTLEYDRSISDDGIVKEGQPSRPDTGVYHEAGRAPAPRILVPVSSLQRSEGQSAHFACRIEPANDATTKVEWSKDGQPLVTGSRIKSVFEFGIASLNFKDVTAEDSGTITCTVTNESGTAESSAKLVCRAQGSLITKSQLPEEMRAGIEKTLEQERSLSEDSGHFQPARIYTEPKAPPPKFVVPLNSVTKKEGETAHFACKLEPASDSTMKVEWLQNNRPVITGSRIKTKHEFGLCSLNMKGIYPEDSGTIVCIAQNESGRAETSGQLVCRAQQALILDTQLPEEMRGIEKTLEYEEYLKTEGRQHTGGMEQVDAPSPPQFVTLPEPCEVIEGEPARFTVRLTGNPVPRVIWYKDNIMQADGSRMKIWFDGLHYLDIPKTRPTDSGIYKVVGRNKFGMISHETRLHVFRKTDQGVQLKRTGMEFKSGVVVKPELKHEEMSPELQQALQARKGHKPVSVMPKQDKTEEQKPMSELEKRFAKMHEENKSKEPLKPKPKAPPPVASKPSKPTPAASMESPIAKDQKARIHTDRAEVFLMKIKLVEDVAKPEQINKDLAAAPLSFDSTLPFSSESEDEKEALVDEVVNTEKETGPEPVKLEVLAYQPHQKSSSEMSSSDEIDRQYEANITFHPAETAKEGSSGSSSDSDFDHIYEKAVIQKDAHAKPIQTKIEDLFQPSDEEEGKDGTREGSPPGSSSEADYYEELHSEPKKKRSPSATSSDGYLTPEDAKAENKDNGEYLTPDSARKHGREYGRSEGSSSLRSSDEEEEESEDEPEVRAINRDLSRRSGKPMPPKIIVPLDDFTCKESNDVFFEVEFVASPKPEVQWYLDGALIHHSEEFEVLVDNTCSSLFIPEALPDDSGMIKVMIKNSEGEATCSACLTVEESHTSKSTQGQAPEFVMPPQKTVVPAGEPARFTVRVAGSPKPRVEWFKAGQRLSTNPRFKMLQDEDVNTLLLLEARPEDSGMYRCEVINSAGSVSHTAHLIVERGEAPGPGMPGGGVAPVIQTPIRDIEVGEGSPVEFACQVSGNPAPSISWYLNNALIKPSRYFHMIYEDGVARLQINEVFPEDAGVYTCEATNSAGSVACSARLTVAGESSGEDL